MAMLWATINICMVYYYAGAVVYTMASAMASPGTIAMDFCHDGLRLQCLRNAISWLWSGMGRHGPWH